MPQSTGMRRTRSATEPFGPGAGPAPEGEVQPRGWRRARPAAAAVGLRAGARGGTGSIEAEGLVRRFGAATAVAGVDLRVEQGEIFGFLGPNGAGKTTCVRMLVTLLRPTSGRAWVSGHDVVSQRDRVRRAVGVALQEAAIDPFMTGHELLRLQGALHGMSRDRAAARGAELLERVGLTGVAHHVVSTYSGGMRRRLDLAMALLHDPEVLFLDEPTAGLDPLSRASVWEEVRALNSEQGTTVFLTTHYLEEADRLAGRIAILDAGRIVKEGRPERLRAEAGAPTLTMTLASAGHHPAREVLGRFGPVVPGAEGRLAVRLRGGAADVAQVVRALDAAGIVAETLELSPPTLDDVFAAVTGRRIEDDEPDAEGIRGTEGS